MDWQLDPELKIALRMVYSSKYASPLDHLQKKADVWNRVIKDIKTIKDRGAFVPEKTMASQESESRQDKPIPGVKHWKQDIMKITPADQRWIGMRKRFDTAIAELSSEDGWGTVHMMP